MLPEGATAADLEAAYLRRGGQLVACDAARRLAVETLAAERALIDAWARSPAPIAEVLLLDGGG